MTCPGHFIFRNTAVAVWGDTEWRQRPSRKQLLSPGYTGDSYRERGWSKQRGGLMEMPEQSRSTELLEPRMRSD